MPSTQAISVATTSSATVQGRAFQIRVETGVGKADRDGPKSATSTRCQNWRYCSHSVPSRPYSSRSDWRSMSIASGLVLPNEVAAEIVCSIGSIGVMWVTKKAMLMPMKMTSRNWASRLPT